MKKTIKILLLFLTNISLAQTLSSSLSKKKIDLGEVITMKINVQNLQGKEVISAQKNGLLPFNFEEYRDDIQQDKNQYTRTIEFTILDEGTFQIPALEFKIGDEIQRTIPYEIEVINPAQKGDEIKDIMPNHQVKLDFMDYWELYKIHILGILAILGGVFGFILWKKGRKMPMKITNKNPKQEALEFLNLLRNKNYPTNGEYRLFYIDLQKIIRKFLGERYSIPAHILLTDDLVEAIQKSEEISTENKKILAEILTRGDWVKFAKVIPNQSDMKQDLEKIESWIKNS